MLHIHGARRYIYVLENIEYRSARALLSGVGQEQ